MALTPSNLGRRYAPLIALAVVQLILVALAPSNGGSAATSTAAGAFNPTAAGSSFGAPTAGAGGAAGTDPGAAAGAATAGGGVTGAAAGQTATGGGGVAGGPAAGGATGGGAPGGTSAGGPGAATGVAGATGGAKPGGVTSAGGGGGGSVANPGCVNGRQQGPTYYMPSCVASYTPQPVASMQGVTPTTINFVYYLPQGNPAVNQILNAENLAASVDQECAAIQAFTTELNKRWELYGRKFVSLNGKGNHDGNAEGSNCHYNFYQGQCNLTPPDIPCYQAEADDIAAMKPAFVVAPAVYPNFYFRLAQDKTIVIGGSAGAENVPENYYDQLAPYFYNALPPGTQSAQQLAEFYCKKLVGKPVQFAGKGASDVIPLTGSAPIRKLGIIYPENNGDTTIKQVADYLAQLINGCGGQGTQEYSYASDITTAQTQTATTVAAAKNDKITTIVMIGDPIAPVFTTNGVDQQGYHPEFLLAGTGLIDYDVLGQLYNHNEMRYAFGVSELTDSIPFAQSDAVKAWQDAGNAGLPDQTQNLNWSYFSLMGSAFQLAGPAPTPTSIAQGLRGAPAFPGTPTKAGISFSNPFPWTGVKDFREVFWCGTATSPINGKPGQYVSAFGGQRFRTGQLSGGTGEIFPNGVCN